MSDEPIQPFGFRESSYERANHPWVCGRQCEGTPCPLGPSSRGQCGDKSTCEPVKEGDRYFCSRPPIYGGPCTPGPLPEGACSQVDLTCQPVPSLLRTRKRLTFFTTALAFGVCLMIFGESQPGPAMSPGPVTSQHGSLDRGCAACHRAARAEGDWKNFSWADHDHLADSRLCAECHNDLGPDALSPHSVSSERLVSASIPKAKSPPSARTPAWLKLANLLKPAHERNPEMACSTCHREHHGQDFDLKRMSDLQCQACHSQQFDSFERGHPELHDYLYQTRTNIAFDHARHFGEYFHRDSFARLMPAGNPPNSCMACHEVEETSGMIMTLGFEQSCADCHAVDIRDEAFPGVAFLGLPAISRSDFEAGEIDPGTWPVLQGSLRQPGLLVELLLEADPEGRELLLDLKERDASLTAESLREHPELLAQYARRFRELIQQIVSRGPQELDRRLSLTLSDRSPEPDSVASEIALLTGRTAGQWSLFDALRSAEREWFAPHASASDPPLGERPNPDSPQTGWRFDSRDQTLRYHASGHADPVLKAWLDLLAARGLLDRRTSESDLWSQLAQPYGSGTLKDGPAATGRCLSCHSVTQSSRGSFSIEWQPKQAVSGRRPFTRFSHTPHVRLMGETGCRTCHVLATRPGGHDPLFHSGYFQLDEQTGESRPLFDPHQAHSSGFDSLQKATCVQCHHRENQHSNCLDCHNYHVLESPAAGNPFHTSPSGLLSR